MTEAEFRATSMLTASQVSNRPPAVICTMSYSGLALARTLGRRGVRVYGLADSRSEIGMSSRFLTPAVYPGLVAEDESVVSSLLDLASRLGEKATLFPTGDAPLLAISRNREKLSPFYRFLLPDQQLLEDLVSKDGQARILQELRVPAPACRHVVDRSQLADVAASVRYPVLLKPAYSASWYRSEMVARIGNRKVILANDAAQLLQWYGSIAGVDPRVVVQEYIPGDDSNLYYVCGYFNAQGEAEALFAGRKLRITPIHFGSASFVTSVRNDELLALTRRIFTELKYTGQFGIEYKRDPRDQTWKVIEINARWGLWDGLSRRCGLDLGYLAYAREAGLPFQVPTGYRENIRWVSFRRDLQAFFDYRREGSLTWWSWLASYRPPLEFACLALDDPQPGLREFWELACEFGRKLRS